MWTSPRFIFLQKQSDSRAVVSVLINSSYSVCVLMHGLCYLRLCGLNTHTHAPGDLYGTMFDHFSFPWFRARLAGISSPMLL